MTEHDDTDLIRRARAGDAGALGELWELHRATVTAVCRRMLSGSQLRVIDEEDLATETFIRVAHRLEQYRERGKGGFGPWVRQIARTTTLEALRRERRREGWAASPTEAARIAEMPCVNPGLAASTARRELLRAAATAIRGLPERYRVPFSLHLEEHSHPDIARALGISVPAVRKRVERARRMLQGRLVPLLGDAAETRSAVQAVEGALAEIIVSFRIVTLTLPTGGQVQLRLRGDPKLARLGSEIGSRRQRLQQGKGSWRKRLELAEICYHSGRWKEAMSEFRRVLAEEPSCFTAAMRLGEVLRREARDRAAADVYHAALRANPPPALAARLSAALMLAQGKDEEAVLECRRAVALAAREREAYVLLHEALGRLPDYPGQLENLATMRKLDRRDLFGYVEAYTPCARMSRWDVALPLMEQAVELDPNDPIAIKQLFQVRMNLRRFDDETLALASRLVEHAPDFASSWGQLAWILAELGRDEESVAVLRQFLADHPANAEGHAALAWRYYYLWRGEEMVAHARRAYELAPQTIYAAWAMLTACFRPGTPLAREEALRYVDEIAARFPRSDLLAQTAAYCSATWSAEATAIELARRAAALAPDSPEAQAALAHIYRQFGHFAAAAVVYERLVEMPAGRVPGRLAAFSAALRGAGDRRWKLFMREAYRLAEKREDDLQRGLVREADGRRAEAAACFRRCLEQPRASVLDRTEAYKGLYRVGAEPHPSSLITRDAKT